MADYPCPTCGKLNPLEAEVCWFCDTQLPASGSKPVSKQPASEGETWLDALRRKESIASSDTPSNETPKEPEMPSSDEGGSSPDWLTRIRMRAQTEQPSSTSASLPEQEDTPDWLKDVKGADFQPEESVQPDWLEKTASNSTVSQPAENISASNRGAADATDSDNNDWMNKVSSWQQPIQEANFPQDQQTQPELSNEDLSATTPENKTGIQQEDWFTNREAKGETTDSSVASSDKESADQIGSEEDLPDWFKNLEAENIKSPQTDSDRMENIQPHDLSTEPAPLNSSDRESEAENVKEQSSIPDWLGETPESATLNNPASEEIPDWLKKKQPQSVPEEQNAVEETPEWLNKFSSEGSAVSVQTSDSSEPPDWLKSFADVGPKEEESSQAAAIPEAAEVGDSTSTDVPSRKDWWSKVNQPDEQRVSESEEKAPDWLSNIATNLPDKEAVSLPSAYPPAELTTSFSDVISTSVPPSTPLNIEEESATISPFSQADMPEWLSTFGDKKDKGKDEVRADDGTGLIPAELPDWLKAMRPVEAIARNTEDLDREVAKFGPLAGMQGVLPGEKSALLYGKPPVYSNKLEATERQKSQSALLDVLLAESRRPQPPMAEPSTLPSRLLRMAAGFILLIAVLVPLLLGANLFALPVSYPAYVVGFHNNIESLPDNGAVLIVFDYEPALSGELNNAAQPVLMRLMQKKIRIASVTTIPAGVVMADNLINVVKLGQPTFNLETNYRNLGFLPGNATGVRQFGGSPLTIDFQGILSISDFSAIILISDSLEGGQAWIEQVGQKLNAPPMIMISSAQAAPVLQPYYRSGQLDGMLVGLPGSVAYSQITGTPSRASSYWDSYQAGLLVVLGMMSAGAIWQLLSTLLRKKA